MAARTKSKVTPKYKTKYRVRNWSTYEAALRNRGDITVWFDEAAMGAWNASPSGRPRGQRSAILRSSRISRFDFLMRRHLLRLR